MRQTKQAAQGTLLTRLTLAALIAWGVWRTSQTLWAPPHALHYPTQPHWVLLMRVDQAERAPWARVGWARVQETAQGLSLERHTQLSEGGEVAITRRSLSREGGGGGVRSERLEWSFEVGRQRSGGEVSVRCDEARCQVSFYEPQGAPQGEVGGEALGEAVEVTSVNPRAPFYGELWPWQLSQKARCEGQKPSRLAVLNVMNSRLEGSEEVEGGGLTLNRADHPPQLLKAMGVLCGVSYQRGEVRGEVWWSAAGELLWWSGQQGALSWRLVSPQHANTLTQKGEAPPLSLKTLARVPLKSTQPPPSPSAWLKRSWARVELRVKGEPTPLLASERQAPPPPLGSASNPARRAVTLVKRGRALNELRSTEKEGEGSERLDAPPIKPQPQAVQALIKELIPPHTSPLERASRLLWWVREHIKVEERAGLPSVEEVLTSREGDCNEQSALLTSLYRAAGLHAEQVFGLVALDDHAGYHAWVRVWLQGAWVEVDPARGLDYASAGHWAVSAGEASAQAELEGLLFNAEVGLESWR